MSIADAIRKEGNQVVREILKAIPQLTVDRCGDDRRSIVVYYMGSAVWIVNSKEGWVRPLSDVPNIVKVLKGQ